MTELRDYQSEAIEALYDYFSAEDGNPLIVMPTGTGKSVVLAAFLRQAIEGWSDTRVLVLTHVKELIKQDFDALIRLWPMAPAGIYSAGLNKRDINAQILFAGIQSIHKRAYAVQRCDLVLIDEAHLLSKSDRGMYRGFLKSLREINPHLKIIGFTATPYRMDSGLLHVGEGRLFTDIAYEVPILKMIEQGYLSPVVSKSTTTKLDVTGVGTRGGEFIPGQLEAAVDTDPINAAVVSEIIAKGADRGSWLIFCSGVKHADHIRDVIRSHGISCESVLGDTHPTTRDRYLEQFKSGQIRALTNCDVLTTGFDAPGTDLIALLRPTKSTGLYVQMLGRGTRLANGKEDCLVLDFAGNVMRHGPLDLIDGRRKESKGDGEAPVKVCPECKTICHAAARECLTCGFEFPAPKVKLDTHAATRALLSTQDAPEWIEVTKVSYLKHPGREGKPDSLRVDYWCGINRHSEWICLEHKGFAREKAISWWIKRAVGVPVPDTTLAAWLMAHEVLRPPTHIQVKPAGKYVEITAYKLA
jgi:DNA repair protein RadD